MNMVHARDGVNRECIVYLEVTKKLEDGIYDAYVDFRRIEDVNVFKLMCDERDDFGQRNTYLHLKSLKSAKRLIRGCYYALNLALLLDFPYSIDEDSLFVGRTYDFEQMEMPQHERNELLQRHLPLDTEQMFIMYPNSQIQIPPIQNANLHLLVRDVDQANWNELLEGDNIKVIYDIGAKLNASMAEVAAIFDARKNDLMRDKPMLVLSHWDMDHIHCLRYLDDRDISACFSKLVCIDMMKSVTSTRVYNSFVFALGAANVSCIQAPARTDGITMHLWKRIGDMVFYVGEKSRNINFSGVCMFVYGSSQSVAFTGDIRLNQAKNMYDQELNLGQNRERHILISPHHGGDYSASHRVYSQPLSEVIISVGRNNTYGHPEPHMLSYLENLSGNNVKRTDAVGDILERL